jgi:hypothetical protein
MNASRVAREEKQASAPSPWDFGKENENLRLDVNVQNINNKNLKHLEKLFFYSDQ